MSHLTQHEPFSTHSTDYGANSANLVAHWDLPKHFTVEIAEGVNLSHHWNDTQTNGDVMGPREQFSARFDYVFEIRK